MRWVDNIWFNALWFQATWFCCVIGRDSWVPIALLSVGLHFVLVKDRLNELRCLFPVALVGISVDVLLTLAGVFVFPEYWLVPLWLVILWWVFAAALYRSFAKIGQSMWLAALLGSIAVPFNYLVGAGLGAVSLPLGEMVTAGLLALVWAALLPALFWISHRMRPTT
jgi:hypothetical protein